MLDGVLSVLRTGCAWADLPESYPPQSTGHDRLQHWLRTGVLKAVLDDLADVLADRGLLAWRECFLDGTFAPAQRGGPAVGKTQKGKGSKSMAIVEADGLPVAITSDSANPHAVKLVEQTREARFVEEMPERLMGDNAYDSDALAADLATPGSELLAPQRSNRQHQTKRKTADRSGARSGAIKWSGSLPGCRPFAACWCGGRGRQKTTWVLSTSPVCSSCSGARYDFRFVG